MELHISVQRVQSFSQNENFVNTRKKLLKNRNWTFPLVRYFTWIIKFISNIFPWLILETIFPFELTPDPFKLDSSDNFGNSKAFNTVLT